VSKERDEVTEGLSGKWEVISSGEYKGYLIKLVYTDRGYCHVIGKLTEHANGEATLKLICTKRHAPECH
jgi:hypothetical protein